MHNHKLRLGQEGNIADRGKISTQDAEIRPCDLGDPSYRLLLEGKLLIKPTS